MNALLLLLAASATAFEAEPHRAALRRHAQECYNAVSDASGLALEPGKASLIAAGLDLGRAAAAFAKESALQLDAGARARASQLDSGAGPGLDAALQDAAKPVEAARKRWKALSAELAEREKSAEKLPAEEKKKASQALAKASAALRAADEALKPGEGALKGMSLEAEAMREARRQAQRPRVELSSSALAAAGRADALAASVAEAKPALSGLGAEPAAESRRKAGVKLDAAREVARQLFEAADRAVNRADELRSRSHSFDRAAAAFAEARAAAASPPAKAKPYLDEADAALAPGRKP